MCLLGNLNLYRVLSVSDGQHCSRKSKSFRREGTNTVWPVHYFMVLKKKVAPVIDKCASSICSIIL